MEPGTDPNAVALQLSYLHHFHMTADNERVRALPGRYVSMNLMPKEAIVEAVLPVFAQAFKTPDATLNCRLFTHFHSKMQYV